MILNQDESLSIRRGELEKALACELDIGDERTEMFEIYGVLHNLGRRGYASQVGQRMNPLLASCDDDDDDNWDEDDD
ncbi:hypothetical protein [Klebsiella michiganensis]|uniref:hypothetical protein n=1 Tax=Klebsiella michiganensis TaxID=1134687 RepID=UPI003D9E237F